MSDKLREIKEELVRASIVDGFAQYITPETIERVAKKLLALFPDMEELKKQIDIKRDYAFGESLFGGLEHQAQMQAAVNTYDVVLNLIKDIGGK